MIEGVTAMVPRECPRVVDAAPFAVHPDPDAIAPQPVTPSKGYDLTRLASPDRSDGWRGIARSS